MPTLSINRVPFSYSGSTMALSVLCGQSAPDGVEGLYLRSFRNGEQPVLRLAATRDGKDVALTAHQEPTRLMLSDGSGGEIEICFEGPRTLRLRGRGGVVLSVRQANPMTLAFIKNDRAVELNVSIIRRYLVDVINGRLVVRQPWKFRQTEKDIAADVLPDENGTWEAAIDEFSSAWEPRGRTAFPECLSKARSEFDAWIAPLSAAPAAYARARELAGYTLWGNVVGPEGFLKRPTVLVSRNWMAHVWSWDHCFNALATVSSHPDFAWDQLLAIFDHQDELGALPDYIDLSYVQYNYGNPPIHGWTVMEMIARNPAAATAERLQTMYTKLERLVGFYRTYYGVPGKSLLFYRHGWDNGWDNSSMFDEGGPVWAPDLMAYAVSLCDALQVLAHRLGRYAEAVKWKREADTLLQALVEALWNGDRFVARHIEDDRVVATEAIETCMPIIIADRLPKDVQSLLAGRLESFMTEYGLASEQVSSPKYASKGYWRGPIWAPVVYMAVSGLERCGREDLAMKLTRQFCELCDRHGFPENFDACTGEPLCDPSYSWTASVFLLLAERLAKRV